MFESCCLSRNFKNKTPKPKSKITKKEDGLVIGSKSGDFAQRGGVFKVYCLKFIVCCWDGEVLKLVILF